MFKVTGGTRCNVNKAWAELSVEERELVVRPKCFYKVDRLFLSAVCTLEYAVCTLMCAGLCCVNSEVRGRQWVPHFTILCISSLRRHLSPNPELGWQPATPSNPPVSAPFPYPVLVLQVF